jgi:hypothetical protein
MYLQLWQLAVCKLQQVSAARLHVGGQALPRLSY